MIGRVLGEGGVSGRRTRVPVHRCAVCRAPVVDVLCTAETIRRDLMRARRGLDGFLHDDARAVYWCGSCGSVSRDRAIGRDDVARYVRCRYGRDALDQLCRRGRAELDRTADRIRARGVVAGARLLEIGSYSGAFLEFAHEAGCRVTGIDVNADVVAHCEARGFDIRREAFEPRRFAVGEFDGVWILNCFEQLPDHARVLAGAARVLRDNGTLVIRTPNAEFVRILYGARGGALLRSVARANALLGMPFAKCFSAPALVRAIEAHGLVVERVEGREFSLGARWRQRWGVRRGLGRAAYRIGSAATGRTPSPWLEMTARRRPRVPDAPRSVRPAGLSVGRRA
jgi:SAM-dependent methyltransferase